ncbi:estradiol 17-beta-dehydrogenase 8 isoform X2 [Halyomorpha halys]|uniref:estradiol 17-beta-dehydrogenase 8 isoform X2 n=1 Tax=Halyomorpha halys TaxID=286706 RepID=UPI0006D51594|nr:estradiol 17-beta-dehydrogenase 8 isoform X2 [Halyomorpha halys]
MKHTLPRSIFCLEPESHLGLEVDVSERESVTKALQAGLKKYSKPANVVVNCAGITRDDFLLKMDPVKFQETINVNLTGTYNVVKEACTILVEEGEPGSIITVGSIIGQMGNIGQANYAASKAGVEALTKSVAKELGMFRIRCNSVIPGFIDTPMTHSVPDQVKKMFLKLIPLARFGEPQEVAEVIAFLASDRSSYINGTSVKVSGGV